MPTRSTSSPARRKKYTTTSTTKTTKKKKNVFQKLISGICNPSKVLNHVVVAEPNAHIHNHNYNSSSSFHQEMRTEGHTGSSDTIQDDSSPPPALVAEHVPLSSSSPSSLQRKAVIPMVRRVSFQDQSCFNMSYRSKSNNNNNNNNSTRTMDSQRDTIKMNSDETAIPLGTKKMSRRLTMTNVMAMTVSSLLVLFIAAVIGTTTTTASNDGFSALFLLMPTSVAPVLPSTVSSTITTTAPPIHLTTTLTAAAATLYSANNNKTSILVQDEMHDGPLPLQPQRHQLPLDSIPTESVATILNGSEATMGMGKDAPNVAAVETRSKQVDVDDSDIDLKDPLEVEPLQQPPLDEKVVNVDDMVSISEQEKADPINCDAHVVEEEHSQRGEEQEVGEAREDEEHASSSLTPETSREDNQEDESFTNPESTGHINEEHGADDAFNNDSMVEGESDVVTVESPIAQVSEVENEEREYDDVIKEKTEIEVQSVIPSEELTAEQHVDEGSASDNEVADATLGEKERAAAGEFEVRKRGKARVGETPDLQDWMVYSNISMAIAFSMAIVASWVDNRKTTAADSTGSSGIS